MPMGSMGDGGSREALWVRGSVVERGGERGESDMRNYSFSVSSDRCLEAQFHSLFYTPAQLLGSSTPPVLEIPRSMQRPSHPSIP